ncbi:MAG TPA: hypothetical protein VK862_11700, partial [Afifellaceae bacterium]|nr:hypothetical protein [Afifellaceae bacterium]
MRIRALMISLSISTPSQSKMISSIDLSDTSVTGPEKWTSSSATGMKAGAQAVGRYKPKRTGSPSVYPIPGHAPPGDTAPEYQAYQAPSRRR